MLSQQLWFMIQQLNPTHDILEVSEFLQLRSWRTAVVSDPGDANAGVGDTIPFPMQFRWEHAGELLEAQHRQDPAIGGEWVLPKQEDRWRTISHGVHRHKRRARRSCKSRDEEGYQPKPKNVGNGDDVDNPMRLAASLVKAGAVLDGEVVMHQCLCRPVFVVFDVLANSSNEPILHLPFEQRLRHLRSASFVRGGGMSTNIGGGVGGGGVDLFDPAAVSDPNVALPLVRKNFVDRVDLDRLLSHVSEERGTRIYRYGDTHHHLTDGIIFQPNTPYVCGTDVNLLKWKYLDTVTIDVEILPPRPNFGRNSHLAATNDDVLRVGVMGEEGTTVDMTRYLRLPESERRRLEADRHESGLKIAEVGFDPTTGEWYYRMMRPDKVAPNHISTVLGTLLELTESLSMEKLRYCMSMPTGTRDTYTKDVRNMQKQLLDHQWPKNKASGSK
ncbi:hypothetical protein ACHAXA_011875 [Cyclostephanos tholiformis]|uniref:mRNA guanylyltransferase n=1 Tax=Cyclostephanos tholiformis TaxID=382380 RepID=A0ABD3RHF7_9STRA